MNYEAYISSEEWRRKRAERLALDGNACRLCDEDGTRYRLEVHHRPSSYKRIPHESVVDDLITLCSRCHELITGAIRGDRYKNRKTPIANFVNENIVVRMEVQHGLARDTVQVDIILPNDTSQRADSRPAKQMGQIDQADFIKARQNRR